MAQQLLLKSPKKVNAIETQGDSPKFQVLPQFYHDQWLSMVHKKGSRVLNISIGSDSWYLDPKQLPV